MAIETSAKKDENIKDAFYRLIENIHYKEISKKVKDEHLSKKLINSNKGQKIGCC